MSTAFQALPFSPPPSHAAPAPPPTTSASAIRTSAGSPPKHHHHQPRATTPPNVLASTLHPRPSCSQTCPIGARATPHRSHPSPRPANLTRRTTPPSLAPNHITALPTTITLLRHHPLATQSSFSHCKARKRKPTCSDRTAHIPGRSEATPVANPRYDTGNSSIAHNTELARFSDQGKRARMETSSVQIAQSTLRNGDTAHPKQGGQAGRQAGVGGGGLGLDPSASAAALSLSTFHTPTAVAGPSFVPFAMPGPLSGFPCKTSGRSSSSRMGPFTAPHPSSLPRSLVGRCAGVVSPWPRVRGFRASRTSESLIYGRVCPVQRIKQGKLSLGVVGAKAVKLLCRVFVSGKHGD
uniref:Predicted protein n=1 Tax=Physcomitrium patens TaxID=3218 RepID=A9U4T8_PHYPA